MKEVQLKDICSKGSSNLKQKEVLESNGDYPVYGASGLTGYLPTYHQENEYIAIVKDGSGIGRVVFLPPKSSVIGTMQYILPKKGYDIRYVGYCLKSLDLSKYKQGAAIPHIYFRDYGERYVKVEESLSEQQAIVSRLDAAFAKIDALKANAEKQLNDARTLFQASFKEILEPKEGWEEKTLKEITTKISDGSHNPPAGVVFSEYEMLSSKNVRNDIFNFDNPRYLSKEDFEKEDKRTNLEKGDVLLTIVGAGLGECCVYDFEKKIVFQRSVSVIKPFYDKIISRFLMYTLQNNYNNIRNASNGAAQKGIYLKQLAEYVVLIPPLPEQQQIVAHLDALSAKVKELEKINEQTQKECDALKQAMLREIFE